MTKKEIEKLAEKIYPSNEISMGYFDDDNEDRRLAFMLGYQAAQSTMLTPDEVELAVAVHAFTGKPISIITEQILEHKKKNQ